MSHEGNQEQQPKMTPDQAVLTGRALVEHMRAEAGDGYDHLFDPRYQEAMDSLSEAEIVEMAQQKPAQSTDGGYTPSAHIAKTHEQVMGLNAAEDAWRVSQGLEPAHYGTFPIEHK